MTENQQKVINYIQSNMGVPLELRTDFEEIDNLYCTLAQAERSEIFNYFVMNTGNPGHQKLETDTDLAETYKYEWKEQV